MLLDLGSSFIANARLRRGEVETLAQFIENVQTLLDEKVESRLRENMATSVRRAESFIDNAYRRARELANAIHDPSFIENKERGAKEGNGVGDSSFIENKERHTKEGNGVGDSSFIENKRDSDKNSLFSVRGKEDGPFFP